MKKNKEEEVVFYEISDFKYYLYDLRKSENTINAYISDLEQYAKFLNTYLHIQDVAEIERDDIIKYIESLKRKKLSKKTIARKVIAIKDFHKFLVSNNHLENVALQIDSPKTDKTLPQVLSIEEVNRMINSIDKEDPISLRNRAMMELLYGSGLRISELLNIRLKDIHMKERYLIIIGKGDKERMVPISEMSIIAIRKYLEKAYNDLAPKNGNLLFYNYQKGPLSRQAVFKYIKKLASDNGIEKEISPHTLRHSFASHMLEGGMNLRVVQELLGHEDIATTQIYTHINRQKLKEGYDNCHPLSKLEEEKEDV